MMNISHVSYVALMDRATTIPFWGISLVKARRLHESLSTLAGTYGRRRFPNTLATIYPK